KNILSKFTKPNVEHVWSMFGACVLHLSRVVVSVPSHRKAPYNQVIILDFGGRDIISITKCLKNA
ncbi:MAG: hypothetical protein AAF634_07070, partial [Bacteroidota bacterium]